MTAISFSVFKSKLLDGSKTQTIREWKPNTNIRLVKALGKSAKRNLEMEFIKECSRIWVGTPLQIYWKQRSKKVYQCVICGEQRGHSFKKGQSEKMHCRGCGNYDSHSQIDGSEKLFDAVCKHTHLIKIWKDENGFHMGDEFGEYKIGWINCLAKRDGFEDQLAYKEIEITATDLIKETEINIPTAAENMFAWFDKKYDLTEPKVFQVIRWE